MEPAPANDAPKDPPDTRVAPGEAASPDAAPAALDAETSPPDPGLPPVQPPSGRFIAQLFIVPGLIILVLVVLFLVSTYFVRREHDPAQFLQKLDSDNADIRWRGASDLAQILKRPEPATLRWKADPKFALDLAERLDLAFQRLLKDEVAIGAQVAQTTDADRKILLWRPLRTDRDHLSYLAAALGEFHAPVGVPILCKILEHDKSPDIKGNTLQRRKALWALMNMGENLKGFSKMPAEQQQALIAGLKEEQASNKEPRAGWARTALYYVDKAALPQGKTAGIVKVDERLVKTAQAEDRFLRELTAMAFNFWDGEHAEATLLKLANDRGQGTLIRVEEND
ncbi:MAG: hypothetical protein HYR84_13360 [Planctomycetes bacterium]|nr:hypothetical protein [Planctomycetota bacterium]